MASSRGIHDLEAATAGTALTSDEKDLAWLVAESDRRRSKHNESNSGCMEEDFVWIERHASSDLKRLIQRKRADAALGGRRPMDWTDLVQSKHQPLFKAQYIEARDMISLGYRRVRGFIVPPPPPENVSAVAASSASAAIARPHKEAHSRKHGKKKEATLTGIEEELARLAEESRLGGSKKGNASGRVCCDWNYIEERASDELMCVLDGTDDHHRHKFNVVVSYYNQKLFKERRAQIANELLLKRGGGKIIRDRPPSSSSSSSSGGKKKKNVSGAASAKPRKRKQQPRDEGAALPRPKQSKLLPANKSNRGGGSVELNCFEEEIILLGEKSRLIKANDNYNWTYVKDNASDRLKEEMERRNVFGGASGGTKIGRITRIQSNKGVKPVFRARQGEVRASLLPRGDIRDKHEVGDEVYASYTDGMYYLGTVTDYHRVDSSGRRLYSVHFEGDDDDDQQDNVDEVFVFAKRDYVLWTEREQKGLSRGLLYRFDPSKDADADKWLHKRGWWQTELTGEEKFGSITAAMRAYDRAFVQANGPRTRREDLNLPEEHFSSGAQGPSSFSCDVSGPSNSSRAATSTVRASRNSVPISSERFHKAGSSSAANNSIAFPNQVADGDDSGADFGVKETSREAAAASRTADSAMVSPHQIADGDSGAAFGVRETNCQAAAASAAARSHPQQPTCSTSVHQRRALEKLKQSHMLQMQRFQSEHRNIEEESRRYLGELETLVETVAGNGDGDDEGSATALQRSLLLEDARETHGSHLERLNEQNRRLMEEHRRYVTDTKKKFSRLLQSIEGQEPI